MTSDSGYVNVVGMHNILPKENAQYMMSLPVIKHDDQATRVGSGGLLSLSH
jgi:hypothetical protein